MKQLMMKMGVALMSTSLMAASAHAQDKSEVMAADSSVAKSERQAVINFGRLWIEDPKVSLPVKYCPLEGDCVDAGTWNITLAEGWVQKYMTKNVPVLVTPRYDQIKAEGNALSLITPTSETQVDGYTIQGPEAFVIPTYEKFRDKYLKSLGVLAPTLKKAQAAFNEARSKNLADQEAGTFMAQNAESAGIPLSVYEKLTRSTYAFGVWMPKIEGEIRVSQRENALTKEIYYDTSMTAPVLPKLVVASFDGNRFNTDLEESAGDGAMSMISSLLAGSSGVETNYKPTRSHAQQIFEQVFDDSLRDAFIQLGNKLKRDRRFALAAPIALNGDQDPAVQLGCKEGIRVGHPFHAVRKVDGEEEDNGLFRIYEAADNCKADNPSVLVGRGGSFEEYDLAVEQPYGGFYLGLQPFGAMANYTLDIDGTETVSNLTLAGLAFDMIGDLGYIVNSSALADTYAHLRVGGGVVLTAEDKDGKEQEFDFSMYAPVNIGIEKRLYFGGMYLGLEAHIASHTRYTTWKPENNEELKFTEQYVGGGALVTLGGGGTSFNWGLSVGADYLVNVLYKVEKGADEMETEVTGGGLFFGAMLSLEFGSDGAGPYAPIYSSAETCLEREKRLQAEKK